MYFDPDWIFAEKHAKQYPNITGLMGDKPRKGDARRYKKSLALFQSMADVFAPADTNSPVYGGKYYNEDGVNYYEPTKENISKIGNDRAYEEWFVNNFPDITLMFPVYQNEPNTNRVITIEED